MLRAPELPKLIKLGQSGSSSPTPIASLELSQLHGFQLGYLEPVVPPALMRLFVVPREQRGATQVAVGNQILSAIFLVLMLPGSDVVNPRIFTDAPGATNPTITPSRLVLFGPGYCSIDSTRLSGSNFT